ncbi:YhcU family protein [Neobacillus sp. LXY-4]|uniref:YhcU family protein n=1 Tax=Neobacillus sp. LXY-4 TaxID=3379826 RepID=UPI003EE2888B
MKIVFASTPGQEVKVQELVQYFYSNIFPRYFSDDEIKQFEREGVLKLSGDFEGFDTLRDAYQVIACLQTVISILESIEPQCEYKSIFDKNVSMLMEMGMHFPFSFAQFNDARGMKVEMLSIYSSAANQYLI